MTGQEYRDNYLEHHGIKGMKWGVRRTPAQLGHPTPKKKKKTLAQAIKDGKQKAAKAKSDKKVSKEVQNVRKMKTQKEAIKYLKKKAKTMSDDELRQVINRIQLEQKYVELNKPSKTRGEKFVDSSKKIATTALSSAAQDAATKTAKKLVQQMMDEIERRQNN